MEAEKTKGLSNKTSGLIILINKRIKLTADKRSYDVIGARATKNTTVNNAFF